MLKHTVLSILLIFISLSIVAQTGLWTDKSIPQIDKYCRSIWGYNGQNVWAASMEGVYFFDGENWSRMNNIRTGYYIWGTASNNIYTVGYGNIYHFDGNRSKLVLSADIECIWGTSSDNIYAIGKEVYHFDGISWEKILTNIGFDVYEIFGLNENTVYAVGDKGKVIKIKNNSIENITIGIIANNIDLRGIWGTAENNIYVTGSAGHIFHWNGT